MAKPLKLSGIALAEGAFLKKEVMPCGEVWGCGLSSDVNNSDPTKSES
jgi:hypothetical protein